MSYKLHKIIFLSIISLILIFTTVMQASAFTYFVDSVDNTITKDEQAVFKLIVKNTEDQDDYFTFSTRDVNWRILADPDSGIVPANSEVEFTIRLIPKPFLAEGKTYFIPVKIRSENTGFHREEFQKFAVYVVSPFMKPGVYVPTITTNVYTDKKVDPREKVSVRLNIVNRNARNLEEIKIVVDGEIFFKEYTTTLLPLEDKTNEILFDIDPLTAAGTKSITASIFFEEEKISESTSEYEVVGYEDLKETTSKKSLLFRTTELFSILNKGNQISTAEKSFRINFIKRAFTKFTPAAEKEEGNDGKTYYVIRQDIESNQKLDIIVITNYRILVIIILITIAGIILYYVLRSPIIAIKNAEPVGQGEEGISTIKVRIYLKNRSRKPVNNLRVIDTIPKIAELEKKTRLGSMEPVNTSKGKRGTNVRWELDVLEPYEERIITYRLNSKLKLIGGIRLPGAKIRFDVKAGKERTGYSNTLNMIYRR